MCIELCVAITAGVLKRTALGGSIGYDRPKSHCSGIERGAADALGFLSVKPWKFPLRWSVLVGYSLERTGLAKRTFWRGKSYITPLGLAVRKALQEQQP